MDEIDNSFQKTFTILPKHLEFLEKINKTSVSQALRSTLDQVIKNQQQQKTNQLLKEFSIYVVIIALGAVFFLFGISYITFFEKVLCFIIGLFMATFGITGGVIIALQSTRQK